MRYLVMILCSLMAGCAGVTERPVKTGEETRIVTLNRTYAATQECSKDVTAAPGWYVVACATFNDILCRITMRPDATDDTLGHESRHCFDGAWHR